MVQITQVLSVEYQGHSFIGEKLITTQMTDTILSTGSCKYERDTVSVFNHLHVQQGDQHEKTIAINTLTSALIAMIKEWCLQSSNQLTD